MEPNVLNRTIKPLLKSQIYKIIKVLIMESITTCKVCFLNYDSKDHTPRSLLCGHTICSTCLTGMLTNSALRKCPFDNHAFAPSQNSLASFALNFIIMDMLEEKKNNTCKAHPGERLKLICLTDKIKICTECAKHENHKDHNIKKIKTLKAQGAKVKEELQQSLLNIKEYQLEKDKDCEQTRKVFIRTISEQFKEIKEILVEKEFELVQQANSLFDADKINDLQGTFAFTHQIDEVIKGITHACQDDNDDMMILDQEVNKNSQDSVNRRTQFLKEKSARVHNKVFEVQNSFREAVVNSKIVLNSLQLSTQELVKEIYSVQEVSEQLSQEELAKRHKKLKRVTFTSYFEVSETSGRLLIRARSPQLQEVAIDLDDLQAIEKVDIQIARYDTLRKDPIPNVLSYVFHGLKNLAELNVSFTFLNFSNESLWWLGDTIKNHIQNLKLIFLGFFGCKFNDDSMAILCQMMFEKTIDLQSFQLNLDSCQVIDADLKILVESLRPFHPNLSCFGISLENNPDLTSHGVSEIFKLIQSMEALTELQLNLRGLKISNESFKLFGEHALPSLRSLDSLSLWLTGSSISDESIYLVLKNLPNVKRLTLDFSATLLTDKTLEMFIEEVFPRLKALEFFSFKFEGTKINTKNFDKIQKITEMFKNKTSNNKDIK